MKDIPTSPPLPDAPPTQDFSKLGFVYITVLGLANQVVPHTGSWQPLATALNYLVRIAPIVYMAFQARPVSPVGVQPDSSMGRDMPEANQPMRQAVVMFFDVAELQKNLNGWNLKKGNQPQLIWGSAF
ncbi:hypothetical protein DSO57_1033146 [Entomophthora muscae]|uniref:Uncharacterized protein n=1 Tax=Entomophthora muscae TaxID=34485 RepID=A0ACC2RR75_9FUNG|nr:hypothetical protein DSO57_1033146 [Entomophthora muscae]